MHLALWFFEDTLRARFAEFVGVLEECMRGGDGVEHPKRVALNAAVRLLSSKVGTGGQGTGHRPLATDHRGQMGLFALQR